MKIVFGLLAVTAMLAMAVTPSFARVRHRSHSEATPQADLQEMAITDEWQPDLIVAPPVSRPAGSKYDTPKPATAFAPAVTISTAQKGTSAVPTAASVTTSTTSNGEAANASVDGVKLDGAKIDGASMSHDGMQTALIMPLTPDQKKGAACSIRPARTPGSILFDQTQDDSALDPTSWAVNVFKKQQALVVYYKGRLFKRYDAVFGRSLDGGAKQWAQDRRTPEGVYTIIEKYQSARFRWFLRLNYPNLEDRVRYETLRVNGVVPVGSDGKSPTVGSAIGIHGTDVPILNEGHINWTTGCISLENKDIDDLERLLPVGTVVIIKP